MTRIAYESYSYWLTVSVYLKTSYLVRYKLEYQADLRVYFGWHVQKIILTTDLVNSSKSIKKSDSIF